MLVNQIYDIMNTVTHEILGESVLVEEDLSNIVDIGESIQNMNAVDSYVRSLFNHIGRVVFVNRPYKGNVPSVLMDGWEFGSIMEKITCELPEATENESWLLTDQASYDPNIFYKPRVEAKFFNKRITFEIPMSFTEMQVKQSFSNITQLNSFMSMIYNAIDKSLTIKLDALIMRTINNMIGETVHADYGSSSLSSTSGVKAVNLLYLYNTRYSQSLQAADAVTDPDFIRFASYMMGLYTSRMSRISTLYNIGGKDRFTPPDLLHIVMLADFKKAADVFLQSDVFHNALSELPNAEIVPNWQGAGQTNDFLDTSAIKIVTTSGDHIDMSGVLAVMFDHDALGVTNPDRRVTTNYNPKAEFYNNWFKYDAQYFNDQNENFCVFFVA